MNATDLESDGDDLPIVAPGEYLATYVRHSRAVVYGCVKVRLEMRLVAHPEIVLSRWYRVGNMKGGRVAAGRHCDLVRELSAVLQRRVRCDRTPISVLAGMVVRVVVSTVMEDHRQQRLAEINRYSRIARLIAEERP